MWNTQGSEEPLKLWWLKEIIPLHKLKWVSLIIHGGSLRNKLSFRNRKIEKNRSGCCLLEKSVSFSDYLISTCTSFNSSSLHDPRNMAASYLTLKRNYFLSFLIFLLSWRIKSFLFMLSEKFRDKEVHPVSAMLTTSPYQILFSI